MIFLITYLILIVAIVFFFFMINEVLYRLKDGSFSLLWVLDLDSSICSMFSISLELACISKFQVDSNCFTMPSFMHAYVIWVFPIDINISWVPKLNNIIPKGKDEQLPCGRIVLNDHWSHQCVSFKATALCTSCHVFLIENTCTMFATLSSFDTSNHGKLLFANLTLPKKKVLIKLWQGIYGS